MTPLLFYGVPDGCSFGSIVALEWLGEPYQLSSVQMPSQSQSAAYRAINPIGETPSLITSSGNIISEGMAIFNHIGALGIDKGLGYRQGTAEFDDFNRMLSFLSTRFFSAYNPLWFSFEYVDDPAKKAVLREEGVVSVAAAYAKLETFLGDRDWLVADRISMAEAYYVGVARWTDFHQAADWSDYPRAHALFQRAKADPAMEFALAIERGENPVGNGAFRGRVPVDEAAGRIAG